MRKYRLLRERLAASGLFEFAEAPMADRQPIELTHDAAYVGRFLDGTLDPAAIRRIGFPWSEGLVRRTLASAGGTLAATADALRTGFGGVLAGGTHHAFRDYGSGFCVFNDIAIATRNFARRTAVIDLDVHQGDGTAALLGGEANVLTLSMHGRNNFPFRKQQSHIDIELDDDTGDTEYLARLAQVLPLVFDFGPELVFFQSGVDPLAEDKLGRLKLTREGLRERDRMVLSDCQRRRLPVVVTLGGGYADPIELTVEAHAGTFFTAAEIFTEAERLPAVSPPRSV